MKTLVTQKKSTFYKGQAPKPVKAYLEKIKSIPKGRLGYIDETDLQAQMYRQYARSKRGKRVNISINGKGHAQIKLVAALCAGKLIAPYTNDGTINGVLFERWFEKTLLKNLPPKARYHSSWAMLLFTRKKSCIKSQKNTRKP